MKKLVEKWFDQSDPKTIRNLMYLNNELASLEPRELTFKQKYELFNLYHRINGIRWEDTALSLK